jgi:hypothetical protein
VRQDERGWVEEAWETVDPDELDDSLEKLSFWTGTAADVCWQHLLDLDPVEIRDTRDRQKMALARYGHQSLFGWDAVDVIEIRRWYQLLKELVESESAQATAVENA